MTAAHFGGTTSVCGGPITHAVYASKSVATTNSSVAKASARVQLARRLPVSWFSAVSASIAVASFALLVSTRVLISLAVRFRSVAALSTVTRRNSVAIWTPIALSRALHVFKKAVTVVISPAAFCHAEVCDKICSFRNCSSVFFRAVSHASRSAALGTVRLSSMRRIVIEVQP